MKIQFKKMNTLDFGTIVYLIINSPISKLKTQLMDDIHIDAMTMWA